jgi:2-phosphosulfolactate phosphatase
MKIRVLLNNNFDESQYISYFENSVCLVIDTLRATSTIATLIGGGAEKIIISQNKDEAFKLKEEFKDYILCGEEKGTKIEGFDYDNSPVRISMLDLKDKNAILKTTNGTLSFIKARNARIVFALSILNLNHAMDCALKFAEKENTDITILCSGKLGINSYDDSFTAGFAIKHLLRKHKKSIRELEMDDNATLVLNAALNEKNIFKALINSASGKCAIKLGVVDDIYFSSELDKYNKTGRLDIVSLGKEFKNLYILTSYIV